MGLGDGVSSYPWELVDRVSSFFRQQGTMVSSLNKELVDRGFLSFFYREPVERVSSLSREIDGFLYSLRTGLTGCPLFLGNW
jgi:hypothetical protein